MMVSPHNPSHMLISMAPVAPEQVSSQMLRGDEEIPSQGSIPPQSRLTMLQLWTALKALHYAYPALVSLYFIAALAITVCTLQTQRLRIKDEHVRRDVILGLIFGATITYVRP
jgi:hypothetical protein